MTLKYTTGTAKFPEQVTFVLNGTIKIEASKADGSDHVWIGECTEDGYFFRDCGIDMAWMPDFRRIIVEMGSE